MSDGLLKKAVDADKWDEAFKNPTPINESMTLGEVIQYAKFHEKKIVFSVEGDEIEFVMRDFFPRIPKERSDD